MAREKLDFDIVIIGAGPAGLSAAIRLAQLNSSINIAILEKGAAVGSHILSGAVIDPIALNELIPDWKNQNPPLHTSVKKDQFLFLTQTRSWRLPTPPPMKNQGNYIISLGLLCRWLAQYAEKLGINIFPSFAATEVLYEGNKVIGIVTGEKGLDKAGQPTGRFQEGIEIYAKQVIFAEGCRGSLTEQLFKTYGLREKADPQTYGLGIKELWEIPADQHDEGSVIHTIGWPLDKNTYGGSFIYHLSERKLAIGFVVGLDYSNPYINPFEEFQRFKNHPTIAAILKNGKRLAYGARALNEGGFQSIPKLTFPGGIIIGCGAGFLNVPRIKGIHNAMKSGMLAAESIHHLLQENGDECIAYQKSIENSSIYKELYQVRNIRPAMRWGLWKGLCYSALDTYIFKGRTPWTFHHYPQDHLSLKKSNISSPIEYPKPNQNISFDLMNSVYLSNIHHAEDQPCHLKLKNPEIPISINLSEYASPESRYCPGGVYEIIHNEKNEPYLQINSPNCLHCKACDIKDPTQNIQWAPPEGGSGPQYEMM